MNKDTEEKVMMLLRTLTNGDNWSLVPVYENQKWIRNDLLWIKEHYDPMYVPEELLEDIDE